MRRVVVIPTYNERENIGPLLEEIFSLSMEVDVVVVDDSSPDGTATLVRELQGRYPNLHLRERPAKTGLGSAYVETFRALLADAEVETIVTMDADFSHQPRFLPELLDAAGSSDVVVGSRYVSGGSVEGWTGWRRALSWLGNRYARLVTGLPIRDLTAGFVVFGRHALDTVDLGAIHSAGYAYTIESKALAHRAGARFSEVPITFEERRAGKSKMDRRVVLEGLIAPWRVRRGRA